MTGTQQVLRLRRGCSICCFNDITKRWDMSCKSCNKVDEEPGLPSRARQGHGQGGLVSQQHGAQESWEAFWIGTVVWIGA